MPLDNTLATLLATDLYDVFEALPGLLAAHFAGRPPDERDRIEVIILASSLPTNEHPTPFWP